MPGQPGLYRLAGLGTVLFFSPGIFLSATRDLPTGCAFRLLAEQGRVRAEAAGVAWAALPTAHPHGTANAAWQWLTSATPPAGWAPWDASGDVTRLLRRTPPHWPSSSATTVSHQKKRSGIENRITVEMERKAVRVSVKGEARRSSRGQKRRGQANRPSSALFL